MKIKKKQKGFLLIELMIVLMIIGATMLSYSIWKKNNEFVAEANLSADQILEIILMTQEYEAESEDLIGSMERFPASPLELVEEGYAQMCVLADFNSGLCRSVENTLWGDVITFDRIEGNNTDDDDDDDGDIDDGDIDDGDGKKVNTHLEITYPLNIFKETNEAKKIARLIMLRIPFVTYDEKSQLLTIIVNRSYSSLLASEFLDKDGNTELEGDWDVGGDYAILNVKDIFIRSKNGEQRSLGATVIGSWVVTNDTQITKPSCPEGMTAHITTAVKALYADENMGEHPYKEISSMNASYEDIEENDFWTVKLEYYALEEKDEIWKKYYGGEVTVILSCILD